LARLFSAGTHTSCRGCKIVTLANGLEWSRVAVVNARGFKGAVERNRSRRLVRESYRLAKHSLRSGFDCAIVLYPGPYTPQQRRRQFRELVERAGLLERTTRGNNG
jgi:ribonuclease P protein component